MQYPGRSFIRAFLLPCVLLFLYFPKASGNSNPESSATNMHFFTPRAYGSVLYTWINGRQAPHLSFTFATLDKRMVSEDFYRQWGDQHESNGRRMLLLLPRMLLRPLYLALCGKVSQRLVLSLEKIISLISTSERKINVGETLLNPLATLGNVVSDTKGILSIPFYANRQMTSRIKMCTFNVARDFDYPLSAILPADHILLSIDHGFVIDELANSGSANTPAEEDMLCIPSIKLRNESDSLAIERLFCARQAKIAETYHTLNYNCGTYCRQNLEISSLANPSLNNFGIGDGLNLTSEQLRDKKQEAKNYCEEKISILQSILFKLERRSKLTQDELLFIRLYESSGHSSFAADTIVQMLVSVAKDTDSANQRAFVDLRLLIGKRIAMYLEKNGSGKIRKEYRDLLKKLLASIKEHREAENWLGKYYPDLLRLRL